MLRGGSWTKLVRGLLWTLLFFAHLSSANRQRREIIAKDKVISDTLSNLVSKDKGYDKRLRPNYGGDPVDVGVTIHVSSISAVSEVEMDYTLDIYLRQFWTDQRLQFDKEEIGAKSLTVGLDYIHRIWVPDTFFPNEKRSFFHEATTHNSFIRVSSDGEVKTSQRLTVTATCPMHLHLFPLDSQECTLEIESYGYSTTDIRYRWAEGQDSVSYDKKLKLPQFDVTSVTIEQKTNTLTTGTYSRLRTKFVFSRNIGFYLIQIYLPSILIVIISWVSFWLSRDATPARVALGVTTVLTMTTLMTTTNSSMPKVSYVKSIDIYLMACFFLVFASLLEYAVVGYLNKRLRMKKENKLQRQTTAAGIGGPAVSYFHGKFSSFAPNFAPKHTMYPAGKDGASPMSHTATFGMKSPGNHPHTVTTPLLLHNSHAATSSLHHAANITANHVECDCDIASDTKAMERITIAPSKKRRHRFPVSLTPSSIDKYSRIFFPLFFLVFNAIYWAAYIRLRQVENSARASKVS